MAQAMLEHPGPEAQAWSFIESEIVRVVGHRVDSSSRTLIRHKLQPVIESFGGVTAFAGCLRDQSMRALDLLDCICVHETAFFRHPRQFEALEQRLLPRLSTRRGAAQLRAWSCACSTGEEAYSIAILLAELRGCMGERCRVLASDIANLALTRARAAKWPIHQRKELSPERLRRHMLEGYGPEAGRMCARPGLQSLVQVRGFNLGSDDYTKLGEFDLISCRNVLIYFTDSLRDHILAQLCQRLTEGGLLMVGPSDHPRVESLPLRLVGPAIFEKRSLETAR